MHRPLSMNGLIKGNRVFVLEQQRKNEAQLTTGVSFIKLAYNTVY